MGFDLDPFDDIFPDSATKNARAGGKFQPKAKRRPVKQSSLSITSTESVRIVDIAENELIETARIEKPSESNEDFLSGVHSYDDNRSSELVNPSSEDFATGESMEPIVGLHSNVVMPDSNGDWHSCFGKPTGENADIFLGLESLDDFLSQPTSVTVNAVNRSPPEVDPSEQLRNKFSASCPENTDVKSSLPPSEAPTVHVSGTRNAEEGVSIPLVSVVDDSARVYDTAHAHTCVGLPPVSWGDTAISNNDGDFNIDNRRLETEFQETEAFPCLETLDIMSELTTRSGQRTGKFQPKPKVQIHKEKCSASMPNPDVDESISCPLDADLVRSEAEHIDEGPIPQLPPHDVLDFSSVEFSDSIPTDLTSALPENEEPRNLTETSQSAATIPEPEEHLEAVPEMPGKIASRRAKNGKQKTPMVSDLSPKHQKAFISGQEDAAGRSLRRRRKQMNTCKLIDESEDEALDDGEFPAECPSGSVINEDDYNDEEYQMENESQNKGVRRKSKKPVAEKEKPVRKRKKVNEVSDQSTKAPPKKFSHSTRRNRRRVDKVLLETPEDEIDFQKLPIRDLILLAEYKERISNKEATTSETPLMNQSAGNSYAHYNENEAFAPEQGRDSNDEQTNPTVQESSPYFNYQTYMDKTPSTRWSKQDTELFYEAVQQFGTDLSMIQQLFPGRTRRQVKLKYKKEERQHPLRLREALTNRAKDHSHFELVIERLQELAAQEKQNSNREDSIGLTGEEMEEAPEINEEEVTKSEQIGEEAENMEPDATEIQSPMKSYDSEDDLYRWNQYKSEL